MSAVDLDVKDFLEFYRESFPDASVLPKIHLLEDHMGDWLRRFHLGAGFMGEQGAESIHAHLNRLESTYSNIPNDLSKLKYIFKMYTLETATCLQSLEPPVKTRKRKRAIESTVD